MAGLRLTVLKNSQCIKLFTKALVTEIIIFAVIANPSFMRHSRASREHPFYSFIDHYTFYKHNIKHTLYFKRTCDNYKNLMNHNPISQTETARRHKMLSVPNAENCLLLKLCIYVATATSRG